MDIQNDAHIQQTTEFLQVISNIFTKHNLEANIKLPITVRPGYYIFGFDAPDAHTEKLIGASEEIKRALGQQTKVTIGKPNEVKRALRQQTKHPDFTVVVPVGEFEPIEKEGESRENSTEYLYADLLRQLDRIVFLFDPRGKSEAQITKIKGSLSPSLFSALRRLHQTGTRVQ